MAFGDSYQIVSWERSATFSSSQYSSIIEVGSGVPVGIAITTNVFPSTTVSFEVSKGTTYTFYTVVSSSNGAVVLNPSTQASQYYAIDSKYFNGAAYLKLLGNTSSGTMTNMPFTLVTRPFI